MRHPTPPRSFDPAQQSIRAKRAFSADEKLQIFFVNNNTIASEHALQFSYIQH